jgi:hypothetical protein
VSDPSPQAIELAANCPLVNRGTDWGETPLWEADLIAALNATIDFYAADEESARAALPPLVQAQIDRNASGS